MKSIGIALLAGFVITLSIGASHADPTTYVGKLGSSDIVVELTDDPAGAGKPLAGRYFYRSKGGDIPLQPVSRKGGKLELSEEEACNSDDCADGKPPKIAAKWQLVVSNGGETLKGSWKGKKSFPVELTRVGTRQGLDEMPTAPDDLLETSQQLDYDLSVPITKFAVPYDFLRVDMAMAPGETKQWDDATSQQVSDPRTKFGFPRIAALGEGVDPAKANATLQEKHWRYNIAALTCIALQYAGFHDPTVGRGSEGGDLGGFDDMTVEATWLSPHLMSWVESGSVYCGGAHPDNFSNSYTMNVASGAMLGAIDLFNDWYEDGPGEKLVAFVRQHRPKSEASTDVDFETDCGIDELIPQNLAARFVRKESGMFLVFSLESLPHVIGACAEDLLELPIADALPLMTPQAIALLPEASKPK